MTKYRGTKKNWQRMQERIKAARQQVDEFNKNNPDLMQREVVLVPPPPAVVRHFKELVEEHYAEVELFDAYALFNHVLANVEKKHPQSPQQKAEAFRAFQDGCKQANFWLAQVTKANWKQAGVTDENGNPVPWSPMIAMRADLFQPDANGMAQRVD